MVRKIGYLEQIVARVFVYAYNAGCWMNLAPENYGCDVKWIFHPISVSILIRLNVTMATIKVSFFILIKKYIFKRNSKNEKLAEQGRYEPSVERLI